MNLAIVGYGKMGKEIHEICKEKNVNVVSIIDPHIGGVTHKEISEESLENVDVVVDFTHPDSVLENIRKISDLGVNIVVGTTGWYDKMEEGESIIQKNDVGLIWSGNFSLGVNMFFKIIERASQIMNKFEEYDVAIHEFHHNQKSDSPSGTAEMIGKIMIDNLDRKTNMSTHSMKQKINPEELHVTSTRIGSIPGTHSVLFDNIADTIELKHSARGRSGFARGSVLAAEWIHNKKGVHNVNEMFSDILEESK